MPLNTDALLAPARMAPTDEDALKEIVNANTAALNQIKVELTQTTGPDKLKEVIVDVEQAIQDLGMKSQKVEAALKSVPDPIYGTVAYGQYPINQPLNPDNPVPWPPGYTQPTGMTADPPTNAAIRAEHDRAEAQKATDAGMSGVAPAPPPPPKASQTASPPTTGGKK